MSYVITGASGHIGNNFVRFLNEKRKDANIVALTRRAVARELEGAVCTQVLGDICDADFLAANIKKEDTVICLAGYIDLADNEPEMCERINFTAAKVICDICREKGARFIYVGSVDGIYKEGEGEIPEPEAFYPDKMEGNYARTKAAASAYVLDAIKKYPDFSAAILLPSAVIGINDYKPSAVGGVVRDTIKGKAQFGIKGGYNFVDVLDVCEVLLALCESDKRDTYIVSGHSVTVEQLYRAVCKVCGRKAHPVIIPTAIVKLCIPFIKVLNKTTVRALTEMHAYSNKKAQSELGFTPTPFEVTAERTVRWFEENF